MTGYVRPTDRPTDRPTFILLRVQCTHLLIRRLRITQDSSEKVTRPGAAAARRKNSPLREEFSRRVTRSTSTTSSRFLEIESFAFERTNFDWESVCRFELAVDLLSSLGNSLPNSEKPPSPRSARVGEVFQLARMSEKSIWGEMPMISF